MLGQPWQIPLDVGVGVGVAIGVGIGIVGAVPCVGSVMSVGSRPAAARAISVSVGEGAASCETPSGLPWSWAILDTAVAS